MRTHKILLFLLLALPLSTRQASAQPGDAADPRFIESEIARLVNEQASVRSGARENLANIGPAAVPALVSALGSPDATLRGEACDVLARIADPRAVEAVAPLLDDPHPAVRRRAVLVLVAIADEAALARMRDALGRSDPVVVAEAMSGFVRHPEALPSADAAPFLAHESVKVRRGTAELLAEQGLRRVGSPADAVGALQTASADEDPWVSLHARLALAATGDSSALDEVCIAVRAPQDWVRARARAALPTLDPDAALRAFRAAAESPEVSHVVLEEAAIALGALGRGEGVASLLPLLASPHAPVRAAADAALQRLTGTSFGFQPDAPPAERAVAIERWGAWWRENDFLYIPPGEAR